jgi:hypothetical protein
MELKMPVIRFTIMFFLSTLLLTTTIFSQQSDWLLTKKNYNLINEPIDVIIPCADKDIETLERSINGIKKNVINVRRVIVVSPYRLTDKAEWFDESNYPFSKYDLAYEVFGNEEEAIFNSSSKSRIGWVYQQFLKLYAHLVIPDISSNMLIVDADTIFLKPVAFLGANGEGLYNPGKECFEPYFDHAARLLPGFKKVFSNYSGISHHMLFQKDVIIDLLQTIEEYHNTEAWKALCHCIDRDQFKCVGISEYEIYFNFVFSRSNQMKIRPLKWTNVSKISDIKKYRKKDYHYVSCHAYMRK